MSGATRNRGSASSRRHAIGLRVIILLVAVGGIILSGLSVGWIAERDARVALER